MKYLYYEKSNYMKRKIVAKGEVADNELILRMFYICHNVLNSCMLQRRQNAFADGKGLLFVMSWTRSNLG